MKIKPVHVLDDATEVWFLVGKTTPEDKEWMQWSGWGGQPTLIVKMRNEMTQAVLSHFSCPEIDLQEKGIDLDHTVLSLVLAVRNIPFEKIPDEYDFTRVMSKVCHESSD